MKLNIVEQLTDREHCLKRPGTYIGSTTLTKTSTFVLDEKREHFIYKEIEYVPGFLKIIYEVLDNSVDEAIRTGFKKACKIDVSIDQKEGRVTIADDGRGIPLDNMKNSDMSMLEGALTCLRAGSNFNDDEGRNLLGMNGVGSSLTNIFSKEFTAEVYDGKRHGVLKCSDNLAEKSCKIKESAVKKTGTTISFIPDLKRFGLKKIDDVHVDLVYQRLVFLSLTYPEIKFTFNGKTVAFKNAKSFLHAFSEKFVAVQDENYPAKFLIGVIPNTTDEFNHKSYINGADCILGGNHLNVISNELVKRIREKLSKKYPTIKVGDIKNRMSFIVNFREFINPMFNSQTKENFSSSEQEIKEFLKNVDWDEFATKICKCQEIIDPIVESFKIKEELQNRKTLDKIGSSPKKFRCKKFMPATKTNKYMLICEGDCLEENTLVFSISDNKNIKIKDIQIGDLVLTHNQCIKPIVNKTSKLINCFKLKLKSGKEIICSKEHRFFVYDSISNTFKWKKLKNLNKETDKLINNKLIQGMFFDKINIEKNEDKKYKLKISGDTYSCLSSLEHRFVVFNKNEEKFEILKAKDLNQKYLMVLLDKDFQND